MSDVTTLMAMLRMRRPAGGPTEKQFRQTFLAPLGVQEDPFGNLYLIVGEDAPSVLWSSHTDSVHTQEGKQRIILSEGFIKLHPESKSNCLGADDVAGMWVMMRMIEAKVPGLYLFHYGEEKGLIGSRAIVDKAPKFLDGIKAAVAFDRRGTDNLITHMGSRVCSDAFAKSLAEQLPGYKLDDSGVLTDTKAYMGIVPECTNLSVGYYDEHHPTERLDLAHLVSLAEKMCKIDQSKFVIERDPKAVTHYPKFKSGWRSSRGASSTALYSDEFDLWDDGTVEGLVYQYPKEVAELLENVGVTYEGLRDNIMALKRQYTRSTFTDAA